MLAGFLATARGAPFRTYLWSLVALEVSLVLAVAAKWAGIGVAAQVLFAAFATLGLYIVWRADQARRTQPKGYEGPSASYIAHVGFTLVALFDAFIVILVLNLGAPAWLVAAAGVLIAVAGHFALRAARERLVESTAGALVSSRLRRK